MPYFLFRWYHDDVIKWKHFPRHWPFVRGIHRSPVNSPHKGQWREALVFSLICNWINLWVNNREAGGLGRHRAHYDTTVMNYQRKFQREREWRKGIGGIPSQAVSNTSFDVFVVRLNKLLKEQSGFRWFEWQWRPWMRPSDAYMRHWTGSSLVQIMACRLFCTKPLSEPLLEYC